MLAGELSECRGSRMQGGDIGWIQRGQTTPMFEQAAFEADIGELVRAETQFGLHLIRVQAERQVVLDCNQGLCALTHNPTGKSRNWLVILLDALSYP